MITVNKKTIFLIVFLLLLVIKFLPLDNDIDDTNKHIEEGNTWADLRRYLLVSRWFVGMEMLETQRDYQYPPLYTLLVIPGLCMDTMTYVLIMNAILSVLTFLPLYLISKRFIGDYESMFLSAFVVSINIVFTVKSAFFPMILSAFLFAWFIHYFIDAHKEKKAFFMSSLLFGLLIFTKYVFFYLLPFIIIWLWLNKNKEMKERFLSIIVFGIPAFIFFASWTIRNIILHGFSKLGAFGGYVTLIDKQPLEIYGYTFMDKIASIFNSLEPNTIMTYYMLFTVGLAIIWLQMRKNNPLFLRAFKEEDNWKIKLYLLLLMNFFIFFLFPAMTYDRSYLNWRYLSYFSPVYLLLALIPFAIIIKKGFTKT